MISKKIDIENLLLYLFAFVFFIPHFMTVSESAPFNVFVIKAFSISLLMLIFSIIFFINFYKNYHFYFTNLNLIIFFYISIYLISTLFSENFYNSFFGWQFRNKGFLIILAMFLLPIFAPTILNTLFKIKKIINLGIFFSTIYSLYGILQFFKIDPFFFVTNVSQRVFSFFLNPNYFTPIILIFSYFSLNSFLLENKKLYLIPTILNLSAIILAQTFTTFLALFITLPIYILILIKYFPEIKKRVTKFILIILIILILFSIFSFIFINRYNPNLIKRYTYLTTLKTRVLLWKDIIVMIKNEFKMKEYLIGIGGENLTKKFMPYKSIELEKLEPNTLYDNAHNEYLEQFIKGGLFLLFIYLILIIYSLTILFKILNKNEKLKETSFMIFISFLSYSVNLTGTYETIQMFLFFTFLISITNSLIILNNQYISYKKNKLIIFIFLIITIFNFTYHYLLNLSSNFSTTGYNSLGFYEYIYKIDKEKGLKALEDSELYFLKAVKFNPFEKTYNPYYLAEVYFYKGDFLRDDSYIIKSINILDEIKDKSQLTNSVYNLMGDYCSYLKESEKAKENYKKSLEYYKFFNEPIISLTKIYINENNLIEAEKYIDIILATKLNPEAYRLKGLIYLKKDNFDLAKKYFQKAIELGDKESIELLKNIDK
mgnify:CR=1 FL=1